MSPQGRRMRAYRPAPFPVYAPNRRPALAALARRTFALLVTAALLSPFTVYTGSADSGNVQLARVELGSAEPVLLSCDFSLADFTAIPPQLGTFLPDRQFLCSGQVTRGVLYGTIGGSRRVILINYGADAPPSIEGLLSEVRRHVDIMNDRRNLLRQAETEVRQPPAVPQEVPRWYWDPGSAAVPGGGFTSLAASLDAAAVPSGDVTGELATRAWDIARLKMLYYSAQEARIDMLAAQFNLQLVLASAPPQDIPGLQSVGGSSAVVQGMQSEVGRLAEAWNARLTELEAQALRDRTWLKSEQDPRPATDWEVFSFMPDLGSLGAEYRLTPVGAPSTTELSLERGFHEARLVIGEAEATAIRAGLSRLQALGQCVNEGRPSADTTRQVALGAAAFAKPSLSELPGYPEVAETVQRGEAPVLYSQLAEEFAGIASGPGFRPTTEDIPEVLYCLAVAELQAQAPPETVVLDAAAPANDTGEHSVGELEVYTDFMRFAQWCSAGGAEPSE